MLELSHLRKGFHNTPVLEDINLTIQDQEIVSILGASGSGKTTLLNLILGTLSADGGKILYNGSDLTQVPMEKRGFNIVFQDYALFPNLTAYENITYGLYNFPDASTPQEVMHLIQLLNLQNQLNKPISQLSGGQKQRVAIARTLVLKPRILLMDEPLSALDGVIKESIKEQIRLISQTYKLTTVIVTHDPEEALSLSDKILILNQGKVEQFGTPQEIINHPASGFVDQFILKQLRIKKQNICKLFGISLPESPMQQMGA